MARQGIGTGSSPNDGTGDNLRAAGGKINDNFTELYEYFGDGSTLSNGRWDVVSSGINTLSSVGIGTTNPRFALEVGAVGASGTSLYVNGDARVTGILTVGSSSVTLNGSTNEIIVGTGITINGNTGIISATEVTIAGEKLTGAGVTSLVAGSNITLSGSTGRVTISASGGGGGGISDIVDDTTPQLGGDLDLNANDITGTGNIDITGNLDVTGISTLGTVKISSGIVTSTSGIVTYYGDGSALTGIATFSGNYNDLTNTPTIPTNNNQLTNGAGYITTSFTNTNQLTNGAGFITASDDITGNAGTASTAGIATYTSEWTLGADGTSNYTFTGPGLTGAENDPTLYLTRGQQYKITNNMGAHPFRIQSTPNGSTGTQYNDGITNNDVSSGTLTWDVQFDAPNILYYQCTSHPNMGGPIYIVPRSEPAVGVRTEVSGTTGSVGAAATTDLDITGFKSYGLLKVGISSAAWVRLYVDGASRTSDATRSYLVDPTPGSGLIAEVRTETAGISTFLMSPGVIGWNNDVSVGSTIYAAVTNNEGSSATITVDLTVVKMED